MNAASDWWKTFFSGLVVQGWLQAVPEEWTQKEVAFLRDKLQVSPPAKLLDVPCGGGRHSLPLAAEGYHVTGVDISPAFLEAARSRAADRQLQVRWEQREMVDLPWPQTFDGAFCFGNSFGYLPDADNARFLQAVSDALKPGARFLLDYPTVADALLTYFPERNWYEIGDILHLRNGRYDPRSGRIIVEHTCIRGGQTEKKVMSQRIYTYRELCELLEKAGFTDLQGYGSLAGDPFAFGCKSLFMLATKGI
jgi:SAM-dependent methyltransferase